MSKTKGPRGSTKLLALAFWAFGLVSWLPAAPVSGAALPFITARPLASFSAIQAKLHLETLSRDVLAALSSGQGSDLGQFEARLKSVEAWISKETMLPEEQAQLEAQVKKLRQLISDARTIGRTDASKLKQLAGTLASAPQSGKLDKAAALLRLAASGSADKVFDNQVRNDQITLVSALKNPSSTASGHNEPYKPQQKATDLRISVPALGQKPAAKPVAGSAAFISQRVAKLTDASGAVSYEVGVADLLRQADAQSRTALSRQIAREALSALGLADKDGRLAAALGDFLRDINEYKPANAVAVHLSLDGSNHFRLIFERADKSRKVLLGQFLPGSAADKKTAFIVMGPIEMSASGAAQQDHQGYWREYTGDERRLDWGSAKRTEEKGWGPWSRQDEIQDVTVTEQVWREGRWQSGEKRAVKSALTKEGKSWLGKAEDKVMSTPVLGHTIKFCDDVAKTLYTGVVGGSQILITAASGSDMYSIEAGGSYAKNPLMNMLVDDQGHLDRLTPGARQELYNKVRSERRRAVESQPYPVSPELAKQVIEAPISAKEAVEVLRNDFGASTYGKRLIHEGATTPGWKGTALTAGGILTGVVENVSEAVFNPLLWATMGLGEAVTAVKGSAAVVEGAAGATMGLHALQGAHAVATVLWWGPWLFSATDNVGKLVETTADGKFDKEYFKKVSEAGTDALYFFVIP